MEYPKGYVFELMDKGGPTDCREPYFKEASAEMIRARTLCAKANAVLPDNPEYVKYLEELFGRKLDDVRIFTPFVCDFGNRVKFGKGVFINHSAILSASERSEQLAGKIIFFIVGVTCRPAGRAFQPSLSAHSSAALRSAPELKGFHALTQKNEQKSRQNHFRKNMLK